VINQKGIDHRVGETVINAFGLSIFCCVDALFAPAACDAYVCSFFFFFF